MQPAPSAANARVELAIGFGFASHCSEKWFEFCQPITERSQAKPKETEKKTFDAQLKKRSIFKSVLTNCTKSVFNIILFFKKVQRFDVIIFLDADQSDRDVIMSDKQDCDVFNNHSVKAEGGQNSITITYKNK